MPFTGIYLVIAILVLAVIFFCAANSGGFIPAIFFLVAVSIFFLLLYFGIINLGQWGMAAILSYSL